MNNISVDSRGSLHGLHILGQLGRDLAGDEGGLILSPLSVTELSDAGADVVLLPASETQEADTRQPGN